MANDSNDTAGQDLVTREASLDDRARAWSSSPAAGRPDDYRQHRRIWRTSRSPVSCRTRQVFYAEVLARLRRSHNSKTHPAQNGGRCGTVGIADTDCATYGCTLESASHWDSGSTSCHYSCSTPDPRSSVGKRNTDSDRSVPNRSHLLVRPRCGRMHVDRPELDLPARLPGWLATIRIDNDATSYDPPLVCGQNGRPPLTSAFATIDIKRRSATKSFRKWRRSSCCQGLDNRPTQPKHLSCGRRVTSASGP